MKLNWMKEILGDSYTDDLDEKVSQALGERFVSRSDFNEKNNRVKELETQTAQQSEAIKARQK